MVNVVYFYTNFLRLHVRQNALLLPFFFSLFAPYRRLGRTYKSFFACISSFAMQDGITYQNQAAVTGHTSKYFRQGYANCEISYV